MTVSRESACEALLALVSQAYPWANQPCRRVRMWGDVPKVNRPALFQYEGGDEAYVWTGQPNPKRTLNVKLIVYIVASQADPGAPQLNAILTALDAAFAPAPGGLKQTLGGVVENARITSVPLREPGDLDGDGILVVKIELILP